MSLTEIFKFDFPIGWNELGVIATVVATVVAVATAVAVPVIKLLRTNKKGSQQIEPTIDIQEKTNNVNLFEKRIDLVENIQSGKFVSETALEALFGSEIFAQYEVWKGYTEKRKRAEDELKKFNKKTRKPDGAGGYFTIKETVVNYEKGQKSSGFPQEELDEYIEISERIKVAEKSENEEKDRLLQLMREFAKESIEPLDAKKRGKS